MRVRDAVSEIDVVGAVTVETNEGMADCSRIGSGSWVSDTFSCSGI
jgi:hypothetical protein